jgi:hypothetical protein
LALVGDAVKKEQGDLRTNIYLCDEDGCGQQAVVVLPDYSKCDEHDKEQQLTELLRKHEERKKKSLTTPKKRVIL